MVGRRLVLCCFAFVIAERVQHFPLGKTGKFPSFDRRRGLNGTSRTPSSPLGSPSPVYSPAGCRAAPAAIGSIPTDPLAGVLIFTAQNELCYSSVSRSPPSRVVRIPSLDLLQQPGSDHRRSPVPQHDLCSLAVDLPDRCEALHERRVSRRWLLRFNHLLVEPRHRQE